MRVLGYVSASIIFGVLAFVVFTLTAFVLFVCIMAWIAMFEML